MRALICLLLSLVATTATAEDFRLETLVYVGDAKQYESRTVSMFHQGIYYDLSGASKPVTIYQPPVGNRPGRFILLDPAREVRTEWTTDRVDGFIQKLSRWAMTQSDPLLRFYAVPEFTVTFDEPTRTLRLTSSVVSYECRTERLASIDRATALADFFDAFARLNCQIATGLPPGPRLELNRQLLDRQLAPLEVRLASDDIQKPDLRAEHKLAWMLSKADLEAIAVVNEHLVTFREVSNADYQQGVAVAVGK